MIRLKTIQFFSPLLFVLVTMPAEATTVAIDGFHVTIEQLPYMDSNCSPPGVLRPTQFG
jgi:hypothetical protein